MDGRLKYEAETKNDYTLAPLPKTFTGCAALNTCSRHGREWTS